MNIRRATKASKDRVAVGRHLRRVGHTLDHGLEICGWSWYKVVSLKPERGRRPEKEASLEPVGVSKEGVERDEDGEPSYRTSRPGHLGARESPRSPPSPGQGC